MDQQHQLRRLRIGILMRLVIMVALLIALVIKVLVDLKSYKRARAEAERAEAQARADKARMQRVLEAAQKAIDGAKR